MENPTGVVFLDLETQRTAEEVGGWAHSDRMGLAIAVAYLSAQRCYRWYFGPDDERGDGLNHVGELFDDLGRASLVVGFNINDFDYKVLRPYAAQHGIHASHIYPFLPFPTFDILDGLEHSVGRKKPFPLDALAEWNLGVGKSDFKDGSEVVHAYRRGQYTRVTEYCRNDVYLTKELFTLAYNRGYLSARSVGRRRKATEIDCTSWRREVRRRNAGNALIIDGVTYRLD